MVMVTGELTWNFHLCHLREVFVHWPLDGRGVLVTPVYHTVICIVSSILECVGYSVVLINRD